MNSNQDEVRLQMHLIGLAKSETLHVNMVRLNFIRAEQHCDQLPTVTQSLPTAHPSSLHTSQLSLYLSRSPSLSLSICIV